MATALGRSDSFFVRKFSQFVVALNEQNRLANISSGPSSFHDQLWAWIFTGGIEVSGDPACTSIWMCCELSFPCVIGVHLTDVDHTVSVALVSFEFNELEQVPEEACCVIFFYQLFVFTIYIHQ